MSYVPITDFLALLRQTAGGARLAEMPGLDYVVAALARAGLFSVSIGQFAPITNQGATVWFRPAVPSWTKEGTVFLWDGVEYVPATPILWSQLLASPRLFQSVVIAVATVADAATIVAVQRTSPPVTTLVLPPLNVRNGLELQIVDWSTAITEHQIILNTPDGATIMKQASWKVYSTPDQLAGLTLRPVVELNGWIIA